LFELLKNDQNVPSYVPVSDPIAGLDIRCGPTLRLLGTHEDNKPKYRGTILLVTKDETTNSVPKVTYIKGPIIPEDESQLTGGEFPGEAFHKEAGHTFWRFGIALELEPYEQKVRYSISDGLTFEFFLPTHEQPMNIVSHSCNGFSLATKTDNFKGSLWFDVIRTHYKENRYHVMLGGGDQVYCDAIELSSDVFAKWLKENNPIKKYKQKITKDVENSFREFYLNQYLKWFGKGFWVGQNGSTLQSLFPFALASIPSMNIFDDHDIIDGFGSYHDRTMATEMFKGVGSMAYKYYMLFQHHTSVDNDASYLSDPSWILSKAPGPYIEEKSHSLFAKLGKGIGFLGFDCRTERTLKRIVSTETYDTVFERLGSEVKSDPSIKHLLVLLGIPIAYPRLVWLEWLLSSSILLPIRKLSQKGIIANGLVNEFDGSVEVLDDLNDHWCSRYHKKERNELVARLQKFGSSHGIRVTILSGDVHLAAVGRFRTKIHHRWFNQRKYDESNAKVLNEPEKDPRLMFNIISSAIVNAPPPSAMASLLDRRSRMHHFDRSTDEDMVPIFTKDVDGERRHNEQFLNRRNWADLIHIKNFTGNGSKKGYEIGLSKQPGPESGLPEGYDVEEERNIAYKVTADSLVVRLHVEKEPGDIQSETAKYEVIIPELVGSYQLSDIGVKK
jgi:hypothetical protein